MCTSVYRYSKVDTTVVRLILKIFQVGLISIGGPEIVDVKYRKKVGKKMLLLQPGYEALRMVDDHNLHCRIEKGASGPEYVINCSHPPFSKRGDQCNKVVKDTFEELGYIPKKKWSGVEFFGLTMTEQTELLDYSRYLVHEKENVPNTNQVVKVSSLEAAQPLVKKVLHNAHRNAGPTFTLNRPAQKSRNQFIDDLVNFTSFGDIKSKFIQVCWRK